MDSWPLEYGLNCGHVGIPQASKEYTDKGKKLDSDISIQSSYLKLVIYFQKYHTSH